MKKMIAGLLCLCLLGAAPSTSVMAGAEADEGIHLPVVEEYEGTSSGLKTTWSCIWFGSYPSSEVVDSTWHAVDDYALRDGDLIRDDALYEKLSAAEWQDGHTELDGSTYVRIGMEDAPSAQEGREQHYGWEASRPWHYFLVSPMRWRILDIQDNKALLVCDRMPDSVPFHAADEDVTWENSTIRSWLNGYDASANLQGTDYTGNGFLNTAFTEEEKSAILPTSCKNLDNQDYGTDSGADTEDCLFLLSNEDVFEGADAGRYGFEPSRNYDDPAKRFTSTLYAKCRGAWWSPVEEYAGNSFWFMRTSGYTPRSVTYICDFGFIYSKGTLVTCSDAGVVPAMWIDLDKAEPEYAGETASTDILHTDDEKKAVYPVPDIADPVVTEDSDMPGGASTEWDAVTFGHYPQTEITADQELYQTLENAAEGAADLFMKVTVDDTDYVRMDGRWFRCDPIVWRVLDVDGDTALLFSDKVLDSVPYDTEYQDVFWEDCDVRAWLNGDSTELSELTDYYGPESFFDLAFSEEEKEAVVLSEVPNSDNHYFGTACGSGTHDHVFILSEEEVFSSDKAVLYGFRPSDAVADMGRRLTATGFASARGVWQSELDETKDNCFWLLRTNGYTRDNIVYVGEKGYLYNRGIPVTCMDAGIVPAIRVNLGEADILQVEDIKTGPSQS